MIIKNSLGLSCEFLPNGSVKSLSVDLIRINLRASTPFSRPGTNLYLRKRGTSFEFTPLLGPESNSLFTVANNQFFAKGTWADLDYTCLLQLSTHSLSWQWTVEIKNLSPASVELDVIYVQDAGLKPLNSSLINEHYVAQYLERRILQDKTFGAVACCRQNMRESTGHPWFILGCKSTANSASVDGIQFYGTTCRESGMPKALLEDKLGGEYAGESSVFALQEKPFRLAPAEIHKTAFIGTYQPDHPAATSDDDLKRLSGLMLEFDKRPSVQLAAKLIPPAKNLFNITPFLPVDDLNDDELNRFFGNERRHCEDDKGHLLSFFSQEDNHIVLRVKETLVDRPHGHIMQACAVLQIGEADSQP